nr:hypothetical protein Q903MT_gene2314 [Picea sitchensis]
MLDKSYLHHQFPESWIRRKRDSNPFGDLYIAQGCWFWRPLFYHWNYSPNEVKPLAIPFLQMYSCDL